MRTFYLKLRPEVAVIQIYEKLQLLLTTIDPPTQHLKRKRHNRMIETINGFLAMCRDEPFAATLLHLAICISNTDLQEAAMELINPTQGESTTEGATTEQKQPPPRGTVYRENFAPVFFSPSDLRANLKLG